MSDRALENEVIRLWQQQMPMRRIAEQLRISRWLVKRILVDHQGGRTQGMTHPDLPTPPESRGSVLDVHLRAAKGVGSRFPCRRQRFAAIPRLLRRHGKRLPTPSASTAIGPRFEQPTAGPSPRAGSAFRDRSRASSANGLCGLRH